MRISVIIPTYKPGDYLFECLDSLFGQTLTVADWEVLIVLNGSKDPWYSQIASYLQSRPKCNARVIYTDDPGVSNARNVGIEAATGEYITFVDDDDIVSKTYLEQLLKKAQNDTISVSNTRAFSSEEDYIPYYVENEYKRRAQYGKQPFYRVKKYFNGPCMKLIHRDIIDDVRFDTRFTNGEDSLFMFAISRNVRYVDFTSSDAIYFRRVRANSATNQETGWGVIKNRLQLMNAFTILYLSNPKAYRLIFYVTRILGSIHSIVIKI